MGVYLDVPYVPQTGDPTGCWYASACMIGYFFEVGPRLGVPQLYTRNLPQALQRFLGVTAATGHVATGTAQAQYLMQGTGMSEHEALARNENLTPVPHCDHAQHAYTAQWLEEYLRKHGPMFFYWRKTAAGMTYGHASVMVGVRDNGQMIYHDPELAANREMHLTAWNQVRQRWKYAQMVRTGTVAFSRSVVHTI